MITETVLTEVRFYSEGGRRRRGRERGGRCSGICKLTNLNWDIKPRDRQANMVVPLSEFVALVSRSYSQSSCIRRVRGVMIQMGLRGRRNDDALKALWRFFSLSGPISVLRLSLLAFPFCATLLRVPPDHPWYTVVLDSVVLRMALEAHAGRLVKRLCTCHRWNFAILLARK